MDDWEVSDYGDADPYVGRNVITKTVTKEAIANALRTVSESERQRGPYTNWPELSENGAMWWATLLWAALPEQAQGTWVLGDPGPLAVDINPWTRKETPVE